MIYKKRILEDKIKNLAQHFKIVFLVGARQVGKSSLLSHLYPELKNIVFDPIQDIYNVRKDPDLFLQNFPSPLILDEIQFVPELLPSLKRKVDQSDKMGQYFLTGSQQLSILKTVSESLAGRVAIVEIDPMTPSELFAGAQNNWLIKYLDDPDSFQKKFDGVIENMPSLYECLWRGGMPGIIELPNDTLSTYFSSYIQTYIERDVRTLENIQDLSDFGRFVALLGALTAQEINFAQLGRDVGISPTTAKKWLNLLSYTYQWRENRSYHGNTIKRISDKPKGYLADSGIACYLQRISSAESLAVNPLLGAIFETYCFSFLKAYANASSIYPNFYHWRTSSGSEVDLVLETDGILYPIEIKCKTNLTKNDISGINSFRDTYPKNKIMPGIVIYAGKECYKLTENIIAVPWNSK